MIFGLGNKGFQKHADRYASVRKHSGPPQTAAEAERTVKSYDYGPLL